MDILDEEVLAFQKHKLKYIMVGGFATNLHGFSKTTADMDIWIKDDATNRASLRLALAEAGLGDMEGYFKNGFCPRLDVHPLKCRFWVGYYDLSERLCSSIF